MRRHSILPVIALTTSLAAAGPLDPPAAPASTSPSLASVEEAAARGAVLLHQADFPLTISQSGHYILAENVAVATGPAVLINAPDVTLDLNGFRIDGPGAATNGIVVNGAHGVWIGNGRVTDFGSGIVVSTANHTRVEHVDVSSCTMGIDLTSAGRAWVTDCVVSGCGIGVNLNNCVQCSVERCHSRGCSQQGFRIQGTTATSRLADCVAVGNQGGGYAVSGTGVNNTIQRCEAYGNAGTGFSDTTPANNNLYLSNISRGNTTGYSGVGNTVSQPLSGTTSPLVNIE